MKKKFLTAMLALATVTGAATGAIACDDGSSVPPPANTIDASAVTQEGWETAFDLLEADGEWCAQYTSTLNNVAGVYQMVCTDNLTSYTTVEQAGTIYDNYVVFDDDTLTATAYSGQRTATTEVSNWQKQTLPTNLYATYKARFSLFGRFDLMKGYRIEKEEGEDRQLVELYSAFAYDEEEGVYSATLWANTSGEDFVDYSSMSIEMTFDDGKLVQITYYYHLDNENVVMNIEIGYEAEVVVPEEALNAEAQN